MVMEIHYWMDWGRAEPLRLLCVAGNLQHKNIFHDDDWTDYKPTTPYGQLPLLIDTDANFKLAQSASIARYLARKGGLMPSAATDAVQLATAEQYQDGLIDVTNEFFRNAYSVAEDRYVPENIEIFAQKSLPAHLERHERFAQQNGANGHFVGTQLTYIDILFFSLIETIGDLDQIVDGSKYPALKKIVDTVRAVPAIAAYIKSSDRPKKAF